MRGSEPFREPINIEVTHAPEVDGISKGKAHKKCEFGCKASIVATAKNNWVIGLSVHHGNPYDGATLKPAIDQVGRITGRRPKEAFVDRGYHETKYHPEDVSIHIRGRRRASRSLRKWLKRRNAIEPIISHNKQDNRLGRDYLKGREGDHINAILSGCGYNLRKLLRAFFFAFKNWLPQFAYSLVFAVVLRLTTFSAI